MNHLTDAAGWRWPHFALDEFACHCIDNGERYPACEGARVHPALLDLLESLRAACGNRPLVITSGYRCPRHNAAIGGVSNSQHLLGNAADIVVAGVSPARVYAIADELLGDAGGVGRYARFTHVDVRGWRARWRG